MELKEFPRNFRKSLIHLFFNHLDDPHIIETLIGGYKTRGYNVDSFYWMDSSLHPLKENELLEVLSEEDLTEEERRGFILQYRARYKSSGENPTRS